MKRLFFKLMALFAILVPSTVSAYDFEVDGIYYYFDNDSSVAVTWGSIEYSGDVVIPASVTYNGTAYSVTVIAPYAFDDCSGLTSVTIPNSVTTIGSRAFENCSGLTTMTIPGSVTSIGQDAFMYCTGLSSIIVGSGNQVYDSRDNCNAIIVTATNTLMVGCKSTVIPNSVTAISQSAFSGCSGLTSVTIPSSVTSIGDFAFCECSGLTSITVESGNPVYDSRNNCNAVIETASNTLVAGCQNTVIPTSVIGIRTCAFLGSTGLTNITIPNSVIYIDVNAFRFCTGLTSVTIPNSMTFIGSGAFEDCVALMDVYSYITDLSGVMVGGSVFKLEGDCSGRTLHVPHGTADAYQADGNWYPYFGRIVEMDGPVAELPGDVNGDLEVNIADINAAIDIIMGGNYSTAADVNGDSEVTVADINAIIDIILGGGVPTPVDHEWVDLGLPSGTLWATCNIGANSPEEYGDYFAWGETKPKEVYKWQTYKWCNGSYDSLTKYCTNSEYGTVDNKTVLEPQDDAAFVNWGPEWRMPTEEQIYEFRGYCSSVRTEVNGVKGRLITGPNGNTIFLPGTGEWNSGEDSGDYAGSYWSRTANDYYAEGLMTDSGVNSWGFFSDFRYGGHTVRAVRGPSADFYIEQKSLDFGLVPVGETSTSQLTLVNNTKAPMTLTATAEEPFMLMQGNDSAPSVTIEVPGRSSAVLTVAFKGTVHGQFDGNVAIRKSASDVGQIDVPVHALAYAEATAQQEYVDLGLPSGTLWATCNVGAASPEQYGDHFAWGETQPKNVYSWQTYKWCNGSNNSLTKYCTNSGYGMVDNLTELEPEDDAAFVNMGPSWRMPTREQLDELKYKCHLKWTTLNGNEGYLVIGLNGNTLFLPAAGERVDAELNYVNGECCYWSREISSYDDPEVAYCTDFYTLAGSVRHCGYSVRAVRMSLDDVFIEQQGLDLVGVPVGESSTDKLTLVNNTMEPVTITATADAPFSFKKGEGNASSMTLVVPANSYAQVTVMFTATTIGQFDGNVTFRSQALNGGQTVIPVHAVAISDDFMHQEYVDLGLPSGTLWAMRDVGASSPEQRGYEFVWGRTTPVHNGNMSVNANQDEITKLSMDRSRGMYDNLPEPGYELGTGSDAAYVNWGPEWRMPSMEQIVELTYSCTCSMARINGVLVRLVTGPNGNTMILPIDGWYWSRTSLKSSNYVFGMHLSSTNLSWGIFWGPGGAHMVRPVRISQD